VRHHEFRADSHVINPRTAYLAFLAVPVVFVGALVMWLVVLYRRFRRPA
jgi:hypothetical protein